MYCSILSRVSLIFWHIKRNALERLNIVLTLVVPLHKYCMLITFCQYWVYIRFMRFTSYHSRLRPDSPVYYTPSNEKLYRLHRNFHKVDIVVLFTYVKDVLLQIHDCNCMSMKLILLHQFNRIIGGENYGIRLNTHTQSVTAKNAEEERCFQVTVAPKCNCQPTFKAIRHNAQSRLNKSTIRSGHNVLEVKAY